MQTPEPHELPKLIGLTFKETVALGFIMEQMGPFQRTPHPEWETADEWYEENGWGQ
jgi:hypothetical protein